MSSDELDMHPRPREDVKDFYDPLIRISNERSRITSHLFLSRQHCRWMSLHNPDEPNRTHPNYGGIVQSGRRLKKEKDCNNPESDVQQEPLYFNNAATCRKRWPKNNALAMLPSAPFTEHSEMHRMLTLSGHKQTPASVHWT